MKGLTTSTLSAAATALRLTSAEADYWFRWLMDESAKMNTSTSVANLPHNKHLNRWHNVLPADATRVVLSPKVRPNSDYINANHVLVPEAGRSYILSQGPLDETVADFWAMVWQQNTRAIVMLCKTVEGGMCKCSHYWPVNPSHASDSSAIPLKLKEAGLEIKLVDTKTDIAADARIRTMELISKSGSSSSSTETSNGGGSCDSHASSSRTVVQYHFQSWPDFGVPSTPDSFLNFLRLVNRDHPSLPGSPNVVHCSAGIGRSGTFCLVDSCLEKVAASASSSDHQPALSQKEVLQMLVKMRRQRDGQVQTSDQLRFALNAISEAMLCLEEDEDEDEDGDEEEEETEAIVPDDAASLADEATPEAVEADEAASLDGGDDDISANNGGEASKPQNGRPQSAADAATAPANGQAAHAASVTRDSRKRNSLTAPDDLDDGCEGAGDRDGSAPGGDSSNQDTVIRPIEKRPKKDC